jgi:xanthine dehydrogenase molybdenum-binding subunit
MKESGSVSNLDFVLNGRLWAVDTRPGESLLEVLRTRCGIMSTKDGCQPQGQCGCCVALVDGLPKTTCAVPAASIEGKEVTTLEGLSQDERRLIADCFVATAGLQCGFCIPGIAMRAKAFLERSPSPDREQIARALSGHLCRCTGYAKILDAIELLPRARRGEVEVQSRTAEGVGCSLGRYAGRELTLGDRPYVDDLDAPGMLHGAVALSRYARARVVRIDTTAASAVPGVELVVTAADVPGKRWYGLLYDDWPGFVAEGEQVRCVGDMLAAVAAVDEETARRAAALVEVEYEPLEPVLDPFAAMADGAPQVNPRHGNVLSETRVTRGNVERALSESAQVVTGTWTTQRVEHLFLEPESAVVETRANGSLKLYTQGQGIFHDRRQVAGFLGIPEDALDVELVPNGGAFGGKEDISIQAQAALLAQQTGRTVKLTLSREESIRIHPKRHPMTMEYAVGCDDDGRLTAVKARIIGDTGAYASVGSKVLERAAGHGCGPYRAGNVDIVARAVMTNNPPSGAMRGFGANQVHFAIEGALDQLAEKVGIDRWEIRWRNALEVGDTFGTGQVLEKSVGLKETLQAVRSAYDSARRQGEAVGIACGVKNSGIGNGAQECTEMGQGLLTILIQCAVEVTHLPASIFRPKVNSTFDLGCGQTTGSRATLLGGRAVVEAAEKLAVDLAAGRTLGDLAGTVYAGDILIDDTTAPGAAVDKIKTHTTFGFATQVVILDENGAVEKVVAAHDVGRAINPALCEGQVEGSIHMGLGYALTEELPCPDGMPATFQLRELGVIRAREMPEVEVVLIEDHEPEGPFGAKGVGEIGLVPTAAAVAGALAAYDGVRRFSLPMKDSPAARAMKVGRIKSLGQ